MKPPKLAWKRKGSVADNLDAVLPGLARDFFARGRQAAQAARAEELHEFRLAAKQFRYTLELLKPAYGDGLDQYVEQVKELQDHLGVINDCVTTLGLMEGREDKQTRRFRAYLEGKQTKETEAFRAFWERFDAPPVEESWVAYLRAAKE